MEHILLISLCCASFSQSDWSGNDGVFGPVSAWGTDFFASEDVFPCANGIELAMENINVMETISRNESGEICAAPCDLNQDGHQDIVVVNVDMGTVKWWENNPGVEWIEHTISSSAGGARFCRAADFDLDGDQDIVVATSFDHEIVLFTNQDGTGEVWTESVICDSFSGARAVWESDFNSDGLMDIAGASTEGNTIAVWLNMENNQWQMIELDTDFTGAWSLHCMDMDCDGDSDVAAAALVSGELSWWENENGAGTNWDKHIITDQYPAARSIHVFDADNDGDMDAAGCSIASDLVTIWENLDGLGTAWQRYDVCSGVTAAKSVSSCDVNRDGYIDLLAASYSDNRLLWLMNPGTPWAQWLATDIIQQFYGASFVTTADVDSDGWLDVLGVSYNGHGTAWWNLWGFEKGTLTSSLLDSQGYPVWESVEWVCSIPSGTSISLQVRGSCNPSSPGSWSQSITEPGSLHGIIPEGTRYLQYRVLLSGTAESLSPALNSVEFFCNYSAGFSSHNDSTVELICPSPVAEMITAEVLLSISSSLSITLCDMQGRIIQTLNTPPMQSGSHQFHSQELIPGTYFLVVETENDCTARKVIVL